MSYYHSEPTQQCVWVSLHDPFWIPIHGLKNSINLAAAMVSIPMGVESIYPMVVYILWYLHLRRRACYKLR